MGHREVCCGLIHVQNVGFYPQKASIPLVSVNVTASLVHVVAQVEVTQVYVNKEDQPLECVYYFPVNPEGAVTHFQAELDDRVIKGTVKAHEEAKAEYDRAVASQQTAFLGEETKPDIFKLRVGFLKPGQQVKVIIGYVTEVKNEPGSNSIRFYVPTTIAPRYVSPIEINQSSKDISQMQFSNTSPAPLSLQVAVSLQCGIKSITSPSHTINVSKPEPIPEKVTWHKALVTARGNITDMDRDFIINIVPEEVHKGRLFSEKKENGSTAVMVHLVPSFQLDEQKTELIFVLDRSGSMQGRSIALAKEALMLFLHSMPADCYFNIVGFGSSFEVLFRPGSVHYNANTFQYASQHAYNLQANMGGTEILQPLREIYSMPNIPGYLRQIFILTDGEVSNTESVLGIVQANAHKSRVFALGIGDSASHHLVEGIAKAGGGTAAFVSYDESVNLKVLNQLKNGLRACLTDIELEWEGVQNPPSSKQEPPPVNKERTLLGYNKPVNNATDSVVKSQQSPKCIPPVYDGSQLLVFGIFESECPTAVKIKALSPDGPLTLRIEHADDNNIGVSNTLHSLAAAKLVRELELEEYALPFQTGYGGYIKSDELKKEIVEIACKHGITSRYTSFVAVDVNSKTLEENCVMETRQIPSNLAHGWSSACSNPNLSNQQQQMMLHGRFTQHRLFGSAKASAKVPSGFSFQPGQLFGSAPPPATSGFSFGSASQQPNQSFSFGSAPQQQNQMFHHSTQQLQHHSFSFGSVPQQQNQTFSFGSALQQQSQQASTVDLRRQLQQQQQPNQTFSFNISPQESSQAHSFRGFSGSGAELPPPTYDQAAREFLLNSPSHLQIQPSSARNSLDSATTSPLLKVIYLQLFDGSYNLEEKLSDAVGWSLNDLKEAVIQLNVSEPVFATALAIAFFENKMTEDKDVWDLIVKKARKWLASQIQVDLVSGLISAASVYLKK